MKKIFSVFTIVFALVATFIRTNNTKVVANDAIVLTAVGDAHVSAGTNESLNFGRNSSMIVRNRATKDKNYFESYVKFNVPAGVAYLAEATLTLTYNVVPTNAVGRSYNIYTTGDWVEGLGNASGVESEAVEGRIDYTNAPGNMSGTNFATFAIEALPTKGDTVTIDVKDIVNDYLTLDGVVNPIIIGV